jgi:hypothetical protein
MKKQIKSKSLAVKLVKANSRERLGIVPNTKIQSNGKKDSLKYKLNYLDLDRK